MSSVVIIHALFYCMWKCALLNTHRVRDSAVSHCVMSWQLCTRGISHSAGSERRGQEGEKDLRRRKAQEATRQNNVATL